MARSAQALLCSLALAVAACGSGPADSGGVGGGAGTGGASGVGGGATGTGGGSSGAGGGSAGTGGGSSGAGGGTSGTGGGSSGTGGGSAGTGGGASGAGGGTGGVSTRLSALTVSAGALNPAFNPSTQMYLVSVAPAVVAVTVTPTAEDAAASIRVNSMVTASGTASLPVSLQNGMATLSIAVTNATGGSTTYDVVFVSTGATEVQRAYLKASNTGAGDAFGTQLALSGDTLAISAVLEASASTGVNGSQSDNSAPASGAVYVFVRNNNVWTQQAYLKASNTGAGDHFGDCVALSGNTLVVGAHLEDSAATGINGNQADNGATDSGAAYVFVRNGTTWTQQAYLKASNTGAGDGFGLKLALFGDTVAVGAVFEDSATIGVNGNQASNAAMDSGAVYVFVRSGTTWSQQAYLKASNTGATDAFGVSLALSADTLAIGAYGEGSSATGINGNQADNSAFASGAAYVFVRSGTSWTQQAYLKASNTQAGDVFGQSIALSVDTIAVGAYGEDSAATSSSGNQSDNSAPESGAVYVFVRNGTTWSQQAYVKPSNSSDDRFGANLALFGDTLAVWSSLDDSGATGVNGNSADSSAMDSGAVFLFTRSGTAWQQKAYLKASNTGAGDLFGIGLALSADTLVIGALAEDSDATGVGGNQSSNAAADSGAAYVFSL